MACRRALIQIHQSRAILCAPMMPTPAPSEPGRHPCPPSASTAQTPGPRGWERPSDVPSQAAGRCPGHVPTAGSGREEAPCGNGHVTASSSQVGSELPLLKTCTNTASTLGRFTSRLRLDSPGKLGRGTFSATRASADSSGTLGKDGRGANRPERLALRQQRSACPTLSQ